MTAALCNRLLAERSPFSRSSFLLPSYTKAAYQGQGLGVFKNVLLRIVDFLFEFYILGCQTLSAAQLKEGTGFGGQSVPNLSAVHRWRLIKSQISGKQSLHDGCNFTLFCVWESVLVQPPLFLLLSAGALLPLSGHNFSFKIARTASFTFSSICSSINPQSVSLYFWTKILPEAKELFDWSESSVFC